MGNLYTNTDGLVQHYGTRTSTEYALSRAPEAAGAVKEIILDFDFNHIGLTTATFFDQDADNDGTNDSPSTAHAAIPAGSYIKSATLLVKTAFVGATAALNIGTYQADGTAIDADGVDAAIAVGSIDAVGDVIACDGAQVGASISNTAPSGSSDDGIYLAVDADTAVFTAGEARLVVEYITPRA